MRTRMALLAAAVLLASCTEGVAPYAPGNGPPAQGEEPLPPTDVLPPREGSGATPPPAPVGEPGPEPEVPPPAVGPRGSASVVGLGAGDRGLLSVEQVDVDVTVSGVRGRHRVSVEFVPPSGLPYERRSAEVDARVDETRTVRFSLPVAGTAVATSGMSGTWQARFFLDGAPLTAASFTLDP
ncbi:hypothetical protein [Corallococcus macrosporus]|uniref:Putative lipoprotein n=1 Tax=Myxococcus fulvus (strain ATCC BAA-855 / HW-1) TaxID=483219 RepID=F8CDE8_MYXFH|nr:hypothetical protein [Corallococcus macrosporus]AEI67255.1 putative lipoprotein [Corallococcus macrosporus]